jgi:hypothetical protein
MAAVAEILHSRTIYNDGRPAQSGFMFVVLGYPHLLHPTRDSVYCPVPCAGCGWADWCGDN